MVKISWGIKIAILYIGFVLLIGFMVFMCMNQKIDLVSDDYYQKELVFQNKIDETNNANSLSEKIQHSFNGTNIELVFPKIFQGKNVEGEILFFRPSDASKDFKSIIKLNNVASQFISLGNLSKGMYKMQISWKADGLSYFSQETIIIP